MLSRFHDASRRLTKSTRAEIRLFLVLGVLTGLIWAAFTLGAGALSL